MPYVNLIKAVMQNLAKPYYAFSMAVSASKNTLMHLGLSDGEADKLLAEVSAHLARSMDLDRKIKEACAADGMSSEELREIANDPVKMTELLRKYELISNDEEVGGCFATSIKSDDIV